MIEWGASEGSTMTLHSTASSGDDDLMTSRVLDGVKRMLLRLAEAQERKIAEELDADPASFCVEAVEGYRTTAIVLREVAAALGGSAVAA